MTVTRIVRRAPQAAGKPGTAAAIHGAHVRALLDVLDVELGIAAARMPVSADVTEALGSEIHVIFGIDAPAGRQPGLVEGASGGDDAISLAAGKVQWTARVAARSAIRAGTASQLAVNTTSMHFFDPATEQAIGIAVTAR
jgi:hypothetical protein